MKTTDEWTELTRWFYHLTNRVKIKILTVLSGLTDENSSMNTKIYDIVTLSKRLRETKKSTEKYCIDLIEAELIRSPNNGYIKTQRGYRKKREILPEVQLSKQGVLASKMIYSLKFQKGKDFKTTNIESSDLLQFLAELEKPIQQLQTLIAIKKQSVD